jgi:hypothetical protein
MIHQTCRTISGLAREFLIHKQSVLLGDREFIQATLFALRQRFN